MLVLERPVSGEFQMKSCVSFPHQKYDPVVGKIYWHSKNKTLPIPTLLSKICSSLGQRKDINQFALCFRGLKST